MNLSRLKPPAGQQKRQQRVGHGMGSGRGKYSGRGAKGAKSVSGYSKMRGFEGGQMPFHRRLPKRGFTNIFKKRFAVLNIGRLEKLPGDSFAPDTLLEAGAIRKLRDGLKILASGILTRKIHVKAHFFSPAAEEKIRAAGGSIEKIDSKIAQEAAAKAAAAARRATARAAAAVAAAKAAEAAAAKPAPEAKPSKPAAKPPKAPAAESSAKPPKAPAAAPEKEKK